LEQAISTAKESSNNTVALGKAARVFDVPVVLTTVETKSFSGNMWPQLRAVFPGQEPIERSSMNSWDDKNFVAAIEKSGRKKIRVVVSKLAHIAAAIFHDVRLVTVMEALHRRRAHRFPSKGGNENLLASAFFRLRRQSFCRPKSSWKNARWVPALENTARSCGHIFPLKDFVSTVVKTTGTSNTLAAFPSATVLLIDSLGGRNCLFQTAFGPDGRSAPRRNCPELRVLLTQFWTIAV